LTKAAFKYETAAAFEEVVATFNFEAVATVEVAVTT
jgi:hypothetical protein